MTLRSSKLEGFYGKGRSLPLCHLLLTRVSPHGPQSGPLTTGIATGHAFKITTHVNDQVTFLQSLPQKVGSGFNTNWAQPA